MVYDYNNNDNNLLNRKKKKAIISCNNRKNWNETKHLQILW